MPTKTTKVYAIRNRHGSYFSRGRCRFTWTQNLAEANLFARLAHARAQRTKLCSPDLNEDPGERLTVVELTVLNPKVVPDRKP